MNAAGPGGADQDHVCPKCGALLSPHAGDAVQTSLVRVDCPSCGTVVAVRVREAKKATDAPPPPARRPPPPAREKSRAMAAPVEEEARSGALYMFAALVVCLIIGMVIATHCEGPKRHAPAAKLEPPVEVAPGQGPEGQAQQDGEAEPERESNDARGATGGDAREATGDAREATGDVPDATANAREESGAAREPDAERAPAADSQREAEVQP